MNNSIFIDQFRFFNQVFQYASVFISEQPIKVEFVFSEEPISEQNSGKVLQFLVLSGSPMLRPLSTHHH
jgi:hypothetical protein